MGQISNTPQPPYPPQPVYYQAVPYPQQQRMNGLAIAAMVLGIVWVFYIGSILAVIFGHVSLSQINRSQGTQGGKGMAIAGIVLGWIGVAVLALSIFAAASNPSGY